MPANACFIILFLRSSRCKGRGGSVSRRDHNQLAGKRAHLAGAHKYVGRDKLIPKPLSGRECEGGKDSHSRQWRLSMAVFLNRNKRPLAAPIEVAEPFSERPPPSQYAKRWQVAAALSAAVTTTKLIGERPHSQAEPTMQKQPTQTPAALREGARGRGFS